MALSFPYPTTIVPKRKHGQGCTSCVHKVYCQALYWFRRYTDNFYDDYLGIACGEWSDQEEDRVTTITEDDLAHVDEMWQEGIAAEPTGSGISEPTTGDDRNNSMF